MSVRFDDQWTWRGFRALVLENRQLRVTILPELGGKIWSILAKAQDREMLWHNPRVPPRPAHYGAPYDDWFCGGWDEIFPNDAPVTIGETAYADHGEIWAMPATWRLVEESSEAVSVLLRHDGIGIATVFEKMVTLRSDASEIEVRYRIGNTGRTPLDVHWKMHPALPVRPGAVLHVPAGRVIVDEDFGDGEALGRHLPDPDSGTSAFQYGVELTGNRCAVTYPDEGIGFGLTFDPKVLTSVWVFATFSGWRDLQTIILEPCTGFYASLDRAIAEGAVLHLEPGEELETTVTASVLNGETMAAFTEGISA